MTIEKAKEIYKSFNLLSHPTDEEAFDFTEAMGFLIKETNDPEYMMNLGGWYYETKNFDLALKYYDMAAALDYEPAFECLGYVWYYGRTGKVDYEKAFNNFKKAGEKGNIVAAYKLADMYKNGYFVEKNYEKYKEIIISLYPKVKNARYLHEPLPEIFTRLAKIETEIGNDTKAIDLYSQAKDFLAQRIKHNPFFGNLNIMKWLINDLYNLLEIDTDYVDLYDLYYLLKTPVKVSFTYNDKEHYIEAVEETEGVVIKYDDTWYKTIDDFFKYAKADGKALTDIYEDIGFLEVE